MTKQQVQLIDDLQNELGMYKQELNQQTKFVTELQEKLHKAHKYIDTVDKVAAERKQMLSGLYRAIALIAETGQHTP